MTTATASDTTTHGIRVFVQPRFETKHSTPEEKRFVFSYTVTITNESERTVQLLSRHWVIINGDGDREAIEGTGVVGFTPTLRPGQSFSYSSFCPIDTQFGTMEGHYHFTSEDEDSFDVKIGRFYLVVP